MATLELDMDLLRAALLPECAHCFSNDLSDAYDYIDRLCLNLCFHIARELGLFQNGRESFTEMKRRAGVVREADYLFGAVCDILVEEGFAERTGDLWSGCLPCPRDASTELQAQARAACPQALATFELIQRCHDHAMAFLTGREPGLAAIFHRGDMSLWERVHNADRVMSIYADLIPPALRTVLPRSACVLEVGAGTGAVLRRCLPLLRERDTREYWFTDIGPLFVQNAQTVHGGEPFMRFAAVDLNRPLASQGIAPESLDAAIAVNVLHVARDLPFTLRELRVALKPSGCLIGAEGSPPDTHRRWRLDLVYAFLRGWWDVMLDPVLRPRAGFLLPEQWTRVLRECGYQPVRVLPGEDWFTGPCRGGLIFAARGQS